jgi:hypothetical protein
MSLANHPCFVRGTSGIVTIGTACRRLSDVLAAFPQAHEARVALGDPFSPERSQKALRLLSALPPRMLAKILAADAGKRLTAADEGRRS